MISRAASAVAFFAATAAYGQFVLEGVDSGKPTLLPSDAAILEGHEIRKDLGCEVRAVEPHLGFDLRFHAGFDVTIPLEELAGTGTNLTAIFRIISEDAEKEPVYFHKDWSVPPISEERRGRAEFQGVYALGEGKYQVDWLLRDRVGHVCSSRWKLVVALRGKDRQTPLRVPPGTAVSETLDPFENEAPVNRAGQPFLNVLLMFHVAPHDPGAALIERTELVALAAILRHIAQEPRIGNYSITAFNLDQSAVLYRREDSPQVDFRELAESLKQLRFGTISVQTLGGKNANTQFLGNLMTEEIGRSRPDAVVLVGSRSTADAKLNSSIKLASESHPLLFYLNYTPDLALNPWRDPIGSLVKLWKGSEYVISKPADLITAWSEIMSRLASKKSSHMTAPGVVMPASGLVPKK